MPLDVGIGLILGVILNRYTPYSYGTCLSLGIFAALLPDLDYVWKVITTKHMPNTTHRDGLHYPLLIVPAVGIFGFLINPYVGLIFSLGTLIHFIHDSVGIGFGIKWLYPFKKNSYLFLFQIKTPNNKGMPKKRLYSWNDAERAVMISKYGYPDWIRLVYFQFNPFGIFEYSVLVLGIAATLAFR